MIAVCVDDEVMTLEYTLDRCRELPQMEAVQGFSQPREALEWLRDHRVDIAFLDIDMPGLSGMEVAERLADSDAKILTVFVTAHDELVYDSFKYHPFAFVRKKFLEEELLSVLKDCEKKTGSRERHFTFRSANETLSIPMDDILYFESLANYLLIHTQTKEFKIRSTISGVESDLKNSDFLRIHKGFLVNMEHIRTMRSDELTLDNEEVLPIGKAYSDEAKKQILRFMRK
jgi:DNA-binding LytR/AlgR family response regulator